MTFLGGALRLGYALAIVVAGHGNLNHQSGISLRASIFPLSLSRFSGLYGSKEAFYSG
jgi:hypothetical protein